MDIDPIVLSENLVTVSSDEEDSGLVTLRAELIDDLGVVLDAKEVEFTVRREQTLSLVTGVAVQSGDPSFAVTVNADPDEGQAKGFRILDGPAAIDSVTGRVNVYGTGAILFQAFAGETDFNPGDPEADILAAGLLNRTLVVGGQEPTGGPGFLDLWTWRAPQLSLTDYLLDIVADDVSIQFVAVGADGLIVQGSDPVDPSTWSEPISGTLDHLYGVARGATRYVAVGNNGAVTTSTDGLSWSTAGVSGIPAGDDLRSVGYDGDAGEFAAVGTDTVNRSVLFTSPDGLTWTEDTSFFSFSFEPRSIVYSSTLGTWQIVGTMGTWIHGIPSSWSVNIGGFGEDFNDLYVTDNGVTLIVGDSGTILRTPAGSLNLWTTVNSGASYDLETIFANDRYLIAAGEGGRLLRSNLDNGDRWVESITPFRFDVEEIAFMNGLLVGVGQNNSVATSGSGFDWTLRDTTTPDTIRAVATDGTSTVAVGDDGDVYISPDDGDTWTQPGSGISEDLRDVIHAPAGFLAVGTGGAIYSSPDGNAWTPATSVDPGFWGTPPFLGNLNSVHYNGSSYAAVGEGLAILTSADGLEWIQRTIGSLDLNGVTSKNGTFLAVGEEGQVYSSTDGVQWSPKSSQVTEDLYAVTTSESEFLAVGEGGILLTSPNGSTWTTRISTATQDLYAALYFDDSFYAFGEGFALLASDNSGNWESQVAPTQNVIFGAAVAGNQFIAVTDFGGILTSPTAGTSGLENWTFRFSGEVGNDINDVIYGNNGFVAVGDSGKILVSEDGQNWVEESVQETDGTPLTDDLLGVAFGNGLYLAVGNQKLISSTDTENWTVVTTWTVPVNSVSFGNGLFVVTGEESTIFHSTNGTSWLGGSVNGINDAATLYDSVYDPDFEVWVAVGEPSAFELSPDERVNMTQLFVSTDGQTWTRQAAPQINADDYFAQPMLTASAGSGIVRAFGNGRLIYNPVAETWTIEALSDFMTNASLYSEGNGFGGFVYAGINGAIAGIDPNFISFPGVSEDINGLAFGNQSYVAVGAEGRILYSEDARDWVLRTTENLAPLNGVAVDSLGNYVAVGGGATILRSEDSISWVAASDIPELIGDGKLNAVASKTDGFVAVGDSGAILLSTEGDIWNATEPVVTSRLNSVATNNSSSVAVGDGAVILLNEGSAEWTQQDPAGVTVNLTSVLYAQGQFTAVGETGTILTSPDGITWTAQVSGTSENLLSVGYGNFTAGGYWAAVGESGGIFVSVDNGLSWSSKNSGTPEALRTVSFGQQNFLSAGTGGTVLSSNNSSEWFSRPIGTDYALNDSAFFNGVFTLVGDFQTIVTSGRIEERESQEILFLEIGDKIVSDGPFNVQVAATSGLPVSLEIVSGPATISGTEITLDGVTGTVVVRATQAGSVRFDAATPVDVSFDIRLTGQTIDFFGEGPVVPGDPGSVSDKTFGDDPFSVIASSSSGLTPIIAVASGPAVINSQSSGAATLSVTGAGTVTITANQAGDATRAAAPEASRSFSVGQASQTITFDAPTSAGEADPPLTLTASSTSGLPVTFAVLSGPGSISGGDQLQFSGSGEVTVQASQAGDADYLAATSVTETITVEPAETGDVWETRISGTTNDLYGVHFAGSRFYAVGQGLSVLSSEEGQIWNLRATGGGLLKDMAYGGVPAIYVAIGEDGVPISSMDGISWSLLPVSALPPLNGVAYGAGRFVAIGPGGEIRRSLNGSSWSAISSGVTVELQDVIYSGGTYVAVGENTILVSQNGGANWDINTFQNGTMSLQAVAGDAAGGFLAVGNSGQILYSADSGENWSVRPSTIGTDLLAVAYGDGRYIITGEGGGIHTSDDAGITWKARSSDTIQTLRHATYRSEIFVLVGDGGTILSSGRSGAKFSQTIDFDAITAPIGGGTTTLSATALEGGVASNREVEFNLVSGSGIITGTALQPGGETTATLEITGNPGDYVVRASLPGGGNYLAVAGVDQSFIVIGETQELAGISPVSGDLPFSSAPIGLSATSVDATTGIATGLAVEFEVVSGDAAITGNALTLASGAVGNSVVIRGFNSGDPTYSPLDETFTYNITVEETEIVFNAISNKLLSDEDFFIEARTSNGEDVGIRIIQGTGLISLRTFTESDANGNETLRHQVSIKGTDDAQGVVILEAFTPSGSPVSADPVQQTFYISKFEQNITFVEPAAKTFGDGPFVINASADGGGVIAFALADNTVASIDGATVTILSAGTIKITAEAAATGNFGPATGELTVPVSKASQVLEFDSIDDQFEGSVITLGLTARTFIGSSSTPADPALYPIVYSVVEGSGIASISGNTLSLNGGSGTVKVQASQSGDVNVNAAEPVEQSFSVSNFGRATTTVSDNFYGAAFGGGRYVVVGQAGTIARSLNASTDPTDWQSFVPAPVNTTLRDVAYGNGRFVTVGSGGKTLVSTDGGGNWTPGSAPTGNILWRIEYGAGIFVATEFSVAGVLHTSTNGLNWTARSLPSTNRLNELVLGKNPSGNSLFAAVGFAGTVLTSTNGINWTLQDIGTQRISLRSVAYGEGLFVAITISGEYIYSENGGVTWFQKDIPASVLTDVATVESIAFGNATFRVVGSNGAVLTATPEAIREPIDPVDNSSRWVREISLGSETLNEVSFGGDRFVAVGQNGTILVSLPEIANLTLSEWIESYDFSGLTAGAVTGSDDPDGDGYTVAIEYALLGDPTLPETAPLVEMVTSGGEVMLCFKRRLFSNITIEIQSSIDMVTWTTIRTYDPATKSWDDTEGLTESLDGSEVYVNFSIPTGVGATFLRVRVVE